MDKNEVFEIFFEVLDELRQSDEVIHDNMRGGNNDYIYERIEEYKRKFLEALNSD